MSETFERKRAQGSRSAIGEESGKGELPLPVESDCGRKWHLPNIRCCPRIQTHIHTHSLTYNSTWLYESSTEVRMQCEEFHGSVSAWVAEGPVKRIHWIPLRRGWVCVGQRAGVRHCWSWVIRWVASWGLPRQPPACLLVPARSRNHRHTHSYIQRIRS